MTEARAERVQRMLETIDEMDDEEALSVAGACAAIYLRTARDQGNLARAIAAVTQLDGIVVFWTKDSVARVESGSRDDAPKDTDRTVTEIRRVVDEAFPRIGHTRQHQ